jgi:hypothetical protein
MGLMNEYISKRWKVKQFEDELIRLIKAYNKIRDSYLFVYVSAFEKPIPERILLHEDYYTIHDLLTNKDDQDKLDFFLETPGGMGEVAEEIVRFIHDEFETVSFVISGQAKSAGTIMALSGDEIFMTNTGSLGPIDAQIRIGRSTNSSYDYIEWVEAKQEQAKKTGQLNPFDATMIAQITPGELNGVINTHGYAQDLVIDWLVKYKFKNWNFTETKRKPVTEDMKQKRAKEIAKELTNRTRWRTHGRSIKIDDLLGLGLIINRIEDNPKLADIVLRIHAVCRFIFNMSNSFKIFATADDKIFRQAIAMTGPLPGQQRIKMLQDIEVVEINVKCQNCGQEHKLYAKLKKDEDIDKKMKSKGRMPFPSGNKIACKCGKDLDLTTTRNEAQKKIGKQFVF